jgi:hypothetical protein
MLLVLLKGLYQWLIHNDVQYSYMVIEKRFLRVLHRLGFPARPISPFSALPPAGAVCGAALLDWEEFRVENMTKRPAFFEWMSTVGGKAPVHAMDSDLEPAAGGIRQWLEGQGNLRTEPDRSFVGAS